MLLLKGILLGICVALVSLMLFSRLISTPGVSTAFDVKYLVNRAVAFFGGMGIGFGVVATAVITMVWVLRFYGRQALTGMK